MYHKYFLPVCDLTAHFLNSLKSNRFLILMKSNLIIFSLMISNFTMLSRRKFAYPKVTKLFCVFFHKFDNFSFYILGYDTF